MADITIVNGVYKPSYNWGAPSCIYNYIFIYFGPTMGQGLANPQLAEIRSDRLSSSQREDQILIGQGGERLGALASKPC